MLTYRQIGLTVKPHLVQKLEQTKRIASRLSQCGAEVFLDPLSAGEIAPTLGFPLLSPSVPIDLLVILGGDGTILRTIRSMDDWNVPVLGIHAGTVGFLAELDVAEAEHDLESILCGTCEHDNRMLLDISLDEGELQLFHSVALNEVAISQGTIARIVDLATTVDGQHLATYHADGLIVASPTGSTAYALSAGGPIVHPSIDAMTLAAICPHAFNQRPIVIPGSSVVTVRLKHRMDRPTSDTVHVTCDGQVTQILTVDQTLTVKASPQRITFLRRTARTFYSVLQDKLRWGD